MAGETTITVIGNLTNDPELRFTPSGSAVANFTIASTPRTFDRSSNEWKDGETLFLRASVWREAAENVAESLGKGMRVIASGRLKSRSYETKEGEKRTVVELEVDEVGPSLRYGIVPREFTKADPAKAETAGTETGNGEPTGEDPDAAAAAGRAERRAREFTISPRLYANEDVWFGKDATRPAVSSCRPRRPCPNGETRGSASAHESEACRFLRRTRPSPRTSPKRTPTRSGRPSTPSDNSKATPRSPTSSKRQPCGS
ncbi:single-stranded DNA-binding protein [bacterium RCC_150]